jgi:hypothetical protein
VTTEIYAFLISCSQNGAYLLSAGFLLNSSSMRIPNHMKSSVTSDPDDYKSRSLHSSEDRGDAAAREMYDNNNARLEKAWKESLKDTVAVRYYLRAVVQDAFDRICWNTTELILYRKESPTKRNIYSFANQV